METMKALVKARDEQGLRLDEVPIPVVEKNDVLIKILRTAICGTDLHIYNWDDWARQTIPTPMVIGHEFVGRVVGVGDNVYEFKTGDLVSGEGHLICGHCRNCLAGKRHLCKNTAGVGVNRPGCFAEYLCIPNSNVWACDPSIALDVLACFDPFGNAVHTALSFDILGEDVLITGAGPIGCMAAAVARHAGARHVVITDVNSYRLELAQKMGATRTVNVARENVSDIPNELQMKEGFDVAMEMSGNPAALGSIMANMRHGGNIALLGIMPDNTMFDWNTVVFNGLTIRGIYGRKMYETWYKMTSMIQTGLDITPLITHHFHYTDFQEGFAAMRSGESGKVVLTWTEDED
ncbi:L-threonine 3-dehydrogenase [Desulforhopalus singaporensis]|uniref:L-threonine 3-dehydrogenase n=1 Tax=Desulforhopalus singaporensis TaxID=91360 RepID=A0A1H0TZJ1_9BACT|nr:L-threonine 3-dehydrogenase [Desulforhopalus singaporensis]SDP59200.1 L-threonine 3-dehydrogenase [Desulforhopalus singaporensis]